MKRQEHKNSRQPATPHDKHNDMSTPRTARTASSSKVSATSADSTVETALKRTSILFDLLASPFTLKRRVNPSAAFAEMFHTLAAATRQDEDVARAFASFQKHFKGTAVLPEDAARMEALGKRARKLKIKVGSLPSAMGPGLALMYDAALEALRSGDDPLFPDCIGAREIRVVERSMDQALALFGSTSVTALELALADKSFANHLRDRAAELQTAYLAKRPDLPQGPCEHCEVSIKDKDGKVIDFHCGTEDECAALGIIWLIFLVLFVGKKIWDWLS